MISIDVGNNLLRQKNPFNGMISEKRMLQARAGASLILLGNIRVVTSGYQTNSYQMLYKYWKFVVINS